MKPRALVLLVVLMSAVAKAQQPATVAGTWRLVSMVNPDAGGGAKPYWDDRPLGLIVYTADGHVSAQLYDSRRAPLGARWETVPGDAARAAYAGVITYFG